MKEVKTYRKHVEDKDFRLSKSEIQTLTSFHRSYFLSKHKNLLSLNPNQTPIYLLDGTKLLNGFERFVIGAHGPYIEFQEDHLEVDLSVPEEQEWRNHPRYKVKYKWLTPVGHSDKIYFQVGAVNYADYIVGRYYIDFYLTNLYEGVRQ